jgi:hypothetical protein
MGLAMKVSKPLGDSEAIALDVELLPKGGRRIPELFHLTQTPAQLGKRCGSVCFLALKGHQFRDRAIDGFNCCHGVLLASARGLAECLNESRNRHIDGDRWGHDAEFSSLGCPGSNLRHPAFGDLSKAREFSFLTK